MVKITFKLYTKSVRVQVVETGFKKRGYFYGTIRHDVRKHKTFSGTAKHFNFRTIILLICRREKYRFSA
jgi:hypothetical protein